MDDFRAKLKRAAIAGSKKLRGPCPCPNTFHFSWAVRRLYLSEDGSRLICRCEKCGTIVSDRPTEETAMGSARAGEMPPFVAKSIEGYREQE